MLKKVKWRNDHNVNCRTTSRNPGGYGMPEEYRELVVYEKGRPLLYIEILQALYGVL